MTVPELNQVAPMGTPQSRISLDTEACKLVEEMRRIKKEGNKKYGYIHDRGFFCASSMLARAMEAHGDDYGEIIEQLKRDAATYASTDHVANYTDHYVYRMDKESAVGLLRQAMEAVQRLEAMAPEPQWAREVMRLEAMAIERGVTPQVIEAEERAKANAEEAAARANYSGGGGHWSGHNHTSPTTQWSNANY